MVWCCRTQKPYLMRLEWCCWEKWRPSRAAAVQPDHARRRHLGHVALGCQAQSLGSAIRCVAGIGIGEDESGRRDTVVG